MNKILTLALVSAFVAGSLPAGEVLEDVVEKSFPLDPSGTFSLRAIDGIVEIFGSDSREVTISATKKAFSPERLNAIAIRIDARPDAINIETTSPPEPRHHFMDRSGTVEYSINLPQTARIARVELPNGELVIKGMRGPSITANLGTGELVTQNCFCDQTVHVKQGTLNVFFLIGRRSAQSRSMRRLQTATLGLVFPRTRVFNCMPLQSRGTSGAISRKVGSKAMVLKLTKSSAMPLRQS